MWSLTKKLLILMGLVFFISAQVFGEIIKKTDEDGTINFSNNVSSRTNKTIHNKTITSQYDELISEIALYHNIDPYLITCIIKVESNFNEKAISPVGAMGLMQIMHSVYKSYDVADILDPRENITVGVKHFSYLLKYFNNNIPLALAAYHAGIGNVKKANYQIPPIKATIDYVNRVMLFYNGEQNFEIEVRKLYKYIDKDGTINYKN